MQTKPHTNKALFALCLGFFMVIVDVMITNVALPSIGENLSANLSQLQWVAAGYTLTFACLLLSAGSLGDRLGAKNIFIYGLLGFVLTSLGCGLSINFVMLIGCRFLQGATAAFLVPTSLALIHASYDSNAARAKAIGIWASIGGVAGAISPILGAVLTSYFGWRAVFLVNVPIGLLAVWLTLRYVVSPRPNMASQHFDWLGQVFAIISVASLAFAFIEAGNIGWSTSMVTGALLVFGLTAIAFWWVEYSSAQPLLPLSLFRSGALSTAMATGFIMNVGGYGILFILPFYFQHVRGYSVLLSGLALLPILAWGVLASHLGGKVTSKIGPRVPMIIGTLLGAISISSLLLILIQTKTPSYTLLIFPFSLFGFAMTFLMPAATVAVMQSAPGQHAGIASAVFNASRQVGSLLGIAMFGAVVNSTTDFVFGMHICFIIASLLYIVAALLTIVFVKNP